MTETKNVKISILDREYNITISSQSYAMVKSVITKIEQKIEHKKKETSVAEDNQDILFKVLLSTTIELVNNIERYKILETKIEELNKKISNSLS